MTIFSPCRLPVQGVLQTFGSPLSGSVFAIVGHAADQFAHVAEDGLKFAALLLLAAATQQAAQLAGSNRSAPVWRPTWGRQKRDEGQDAEGDDQERARLGLAALDVAQIVQQNRETQLLARRIRDGHHAHVHAAGGKVGDRAPVLEVGDAVGIDRAHPDPDSPATELLGESGGGGARLEIGIASRRAHHALVTRKGCQLFLKLAGFAVPTLARDFSAPTRTRFARELISRSNQSARGSLHHPGRSPCQ